MSDRNHQIKSKAISDCGFHDNTVKLIELSRFYCSYFGKGLQPDFDAATAYCRTRFDHSNPDEVAMGLLCVLNAMRKSRKSTFSFHCLGCPNCRKRVSECERLLFQTIEDMRLGLKQKASVSAMMLCEGNDTNDFLTSADQLGKILEKQIGMQEK